VVVVARHLPQLGEAGDVVLQPREAVDDAAQAGGLLRRGPRPLRVVPEAGIVEERIEFLEPRPCAGYVKDTPEG
jgi:hypothetical protein